MGRRTYRIRRVGACRARLHDRHGSTRGAVRFRGRTGPPTVVPGEYCTLPHSGRIAVDGTGANAQRGTIDPWSAGTAGRHSPFVLTFLRALGFLAPLAVAAGVTIALALAAQTDPE